MAALPSKGEAESAICSLQFRSSLRLDALVSVRSIWRVRPVQLVVVRINGPMRISMLTTSRVRSGFLVTRPFLGVASLRTTDRGIVEVHCFPGFFSLVGIDRVFETRLQQTHPSADGQVIRAHEISAGGTGRCFTGSLEQIHDVRVSHRNRSDFFESFLCFTLYLCFWAQRRLNGRRRNDCIPCLDR